MRHQKGHKKLGRTSAHRRALLRNMAISLVHHQRIETTLPKAKVLRSFIEKLVTQGRKGTLHSRRLVAQDIRDHDALKRICGELAERYAERPGGYTRIYRLGRRRGDNSQMALIEFVDQNKTAAVVASDVAA